VADDLPNRPTESKTPWKPDPNSKRSISKAARASAKRGSKPAAVAGKPRK